MLDFGMAQALDVRLEIAILHSDSSPISSSLTTPGVVLGSGRSSTPSRRGGSPATVAPTSGHLASCSGRCSLASSCLPATRCQTSSRRCKFRPDWTIVPPDTPAAIRRLLRRSLCKDRKLRLDSATVARLEIDEALASPEAPRLSPTRSRRLSWAVAGMLAVAVMLLLGWWK